MFFLFGESSSLLSSEELSEELSEEESEEELLLEELVEGLLRLFLLNFFRCLRLTLSSSSLAS